MLMTRLVKIPQKGIDFPEGWDFCRFRREDLMEKNPESSLLELSEIQRYNPLHDSDKSWTPVGEFFQRFFKDGDGTLRRSLNFRYARPFLKVGLFKKTFGDKTKLLFPRDAFYDSKGRLFVPALVLWRKRFNTIHVIRPEIYGTTDTVTDDTVIPMFRN